MQLKATGRKVNGCEFGENVLPEYVVESGSPNYDNVVTLPDGKNAFEFDHEYAGWSGLFLEAVSMDAGDNEIRRRAADDDRGLAGIGAPEIKGTNITLTVVGDKQIGWLKQKYNKK